ncbi:peptide MFS transporter [Nonomuraea sediminis]|uniref:peptide MFS transporter n=1 Tax=Nonomuraea sediminis TaxID=2835864 RepID=UPI001BDC4AC8|nr:peptide MFS transporter [Nonomuraea sediminis]
MTAWPRWFGTLFVVDIWERFSFYGMLAILYLYLVAPHSRGGLEMAPHTASALFGIYMALLFMAALPGGWMADRVLGARRAVLYGGALIAAGHLCLAVPVEPALYPGLALIVAGTGLVKPSMAAMIGEMYPGQPERREAVFSVFYMSIQISALFAPLITGLAAERVNWHLGFGLAAAGMLAGLVHYVVGLRNFGDLGVHAASPATAEERRRVLRGAALWGGIPASLVAVGLAAGVLTVDRVLMLIGLVLLVSPILYYRRLRCGPAGGPRLRAFVWMLVASAVFWLLYAQGPALMNLFARDAVDRTLGGFEIPASWFQSAQPLFLLLLAPVFAMLWTRLGARVGPPPKFVAGLLAGGICFVVMALAATQAEHALVSPLWLLTVYLLLVCGELVVGPVGLSLAAEVAPPGHTSRVLGLFWMFAAIGAAVGGRLAELTTVIPLPLYYLLLGVVGTVAAVGLAAGAGSLGRRLRPAPVSEKT